MSAAAVTTPLAQVPRGEGRMLRAFPAKPFTAQRAQGTEVWDTNGRRLLDFGGASHGVALVGHSHPRVTAAIAAQAPRLMHVAQGIPAQERADFLDRLHRHLPAHLEKTFPANSGAEAMECALKLAAVATGRKRFVAATNGFHGRTVGALSVTHRAGFRSPFQGILPEATFVPFNDTSALRAAADASVAAIVLEPVQGEGGVQPAAPGYLEAAREAADACGALLILDEVQSGLGRTGTFLATERHGVRADAVALAKGLAGGLPMGTCSVTAEVAAKLPPGGHGSTYGGSPLACAVADTVLQVLDHERLAERAGRLGPAFAAEIASWAHPLVRDVRCAGLMVGVELRVRPQAILDRLAASGILALTGGTTGVRFLPPLTVGEAQLREALDALRAALDATGPA